VLAEGIARAADHFGSEAEQYVCHAKGMVLAALEPRMMKGTALGLATSTRGADHLRALVLAEFMPIMSPEQAEQKFGTADALELTSYNKAAATIYYQHLALLPDLFEICRFLFGMGQGTKTFSFDDLYELYRLATGSAVDEEQMLRIAERVYTMERAFACRDGMRRDADYLKGKWGTEAVPSGPFAGERLDPEKWEGMLDDYYRLRGWNNEGVPTREKLRELGIEDVAESLAHSGAYG
jgi:aldehyde:ferredoxin oxidoreductase